MSQADAEEEPTLNAIIMNNIILLYDKITATISDVSSRITRETISFVENINQNAPYLAKIFLALGLLYTYSSNKTDVLAGLDKLWRCALNPLIDVVLLNIAQVLRFGYDLIIPLYNFYQLFFAQLISGTATTVLKCDLISFFDTIRLVFNIFIAQFNSITTWTGISSQMSVENNIFSNEFNITSVVYNTQLVLVKQENISKCVCDGLTDFIEIAIVMVKQREIAHCINHLFNIPISFFSEFALLSPPFKKFPRFIRTFNHVNLFFYNGGQYFDKVIIEVFQKIIKLFNDNFELRGAPKEFIFTMLSRFAMAGTQFFFTMARLVVHFLIPLPHLLANTDYMMHVASLEQSIEHFHIGTSLFVDNFAWFEKIATIFSNSVVNKKLYLPSHVHIECDKLNINYADNMACATGLALELPLNIFHLVYSFIIEFVWKGLIHNEESVIQMLQRYDGIRYPKGVMLTCKYRDSINFDLLAKDCKCDLQLGNYQGISGITLSRPYGISAYDPYCGQPNFQIHVLGHIERTIEFASSNFLAQLQQPTIVSNRVVLELIRTGVKLLLNAENLFSGDFWHYTVNCGYGMSTVQLRTWFNETYDKRDLSLSQKIQERQDDNCNGTLMYSNSKVFAKSDFKCKLIDTSIRDLMCSGRMHQKLTPLCNASNRGGCMCNFALDLDINSECSCIPYFPDAVQERADLGYTNPALVKFHNASNHWCNTFWLEGVYYEISQLGFVIDNLIDSFTPGINVAEQYCENKKYTLYSSKIMRTTYSDFVQDKALYAPLGLSFTVNSCNLYASYDVICSVSLSIRSLIDIVINQLRAISMGIVDILNLDFTNIKLTIGERLCDLSRTAAALSSIVPSLLPDEMGDTLQRGVTKIIFQSLSAPIVLLDLVNYSVQWLGDLLTGKINWSGGASKPLADFVFDIIDMAILYIRNWIDAFATTLNGVRSGAGNFLTTIDQVIVIIQENFLNEAAEDIIIAIIKVGSKIIQFFTTGKIDGSLFSDLWFFVQKIVTLFLTNIGKVMSAILDMLGGAGKFIKIMANSICSIIQSIICAITSISILGMTKQCNIGCISVRRLVEVENNTHFNFQQTPKYMATHFNWTGDSTCDYIVNQYQNYEWDDLRPLEEITLVECMENRMFGVMMRDYTGLPVPDDIFYNWKSKYLFSYDFMSASIIYSLHKLGKIKTTAMINEFKTRKLEPFLPVMRNINNGIKNLFTHDNLNAGIRFTAGIFDDNFNPNSKQDTLTHTLYRIVTKLSNTAIKTVQYTNTRNIYREYDHTLSALANINITMPVFTQIRPQTVALKMPKKTTRLGKFILKKAGILTDTTPCSNRTNSYVCIDCLVVDNLINVMIDAGIELKNYYQYMFLGITLPSFIEWWRNESIVIQFPTPMAIKMDYQMIAWKLDPMTIQIKKMSFPSFNPNIDLDIIDPITLKPIEFDPITFKPIRFDPIKMPDFKFPDMSFPEGTAVLIPELDPITTLEQLKLNRARPILKSAQITNISEYERARQDWEWFATNGLNIFKNYSNDPNARGEFFDVLFQFLTTNDEKYVDYFAHGLPWYVKQPILLECPMDKIYCKDSTTSERLDKITSAFEYMLYFTLSLFLIQIYIGLPFFTLLSPYLLYIFAFIYMWTVYQYSYACIPSAPQCFMDDVFAYLNDRLFLNCFCSYLPSLSESCVPETCQMCTKQTFFKSCSSVVPLKTELGIMWAPLFYLRKYYPNVITSAYKNIPFSWGFRHWDHFVTVARMIIEEEEIIPEETECLALSYGDFVFVGTLLFFGLTVGKFVLPTTITIVQRTNEILSLFLTTVYCMALSIELQTVTGIQNTVSSDTL
jgi:hypothetical protein